MKMKLTVLALISMLALVAPVSAESIDISELDESQVDIQASLHSFYEPPSTDTSDVETGETYIEGKELMYKVDMTFTCDVDVVTGHLWLQTEDTNIFDTQDYTSIPGEIIYLENEDEYARSYSQGCGDTETYNLYFTPDSTATDVTVSAYQGDDPRNSGFDFYEEVDSETFDVEEEVYWITDVGTCDSGLADDATGDTYSSYSDCMNDAEEVYWYDGTGCISGMSKDAPASSYSSKTACQDAEVPTVWWTSSGECVSGLETDAPSTYYDTESDCMDTLDVVYWIETQMDGDEEVQVCVSGTKSEATNTTYALEDDCLSQINGGGEGGEGGNDNLQTGLMILAIGVVLIVGIIELG